MQQKPEEGQSDPNQEERAKEPGDLAKQAQEKKKLTIGDFEEDAPPPNVITCCLWQYVLQKIATYEYVELWCFTKDRCFEATKQVHSQADNGFSLLSTNKVLTLCLAVSIKASKYAKADHKLTRTKILQVQTLYLQHLKKANWLEKHISALFKFFLNVKCHPF